MKNDKDKNINERGRVTKINQFPREIKRDCINPLSAIGDNITPNTKGAMGIPTILIKYPKIPKININPTSNMLLFIA